MEKKKVYKRIKIENVYIKDTEDQERIVKEGEREGNKFYVCSASLKVSDDCKDYAGKWLSTSFFAYKDPKDEKKNRTGVSKAEYFKSKNIGQEVLVEVLSETPYEKDGKSGVNVNVKLLGKKEAETVSQFI